MASAARNKRKFVHFALDNDVEARKGSTGPLAEQPARKPATGSWARLAAWSGQVAKQAAGLCSWGSRLRSWIGKIFATEERMEEMAGIEGPAVPGAWVSCPATFCAVTSSQAPAYTAPGTYRLTYDDDYNDGPVDADGDVCMTAPLPQARRVRFKADFPSYKRSRRNASRSTMKSSKHGAFAKLRELSPDRTPSPSPSPEPEFEEESDPEEQKRLEAISARAELAIRAEGRRARAKENGEPSQPRKSSCFTRSPEDVVADSLKGLALNDSEYQTLVRYEQETRKQTARERGIAEKKAADKRRAAELAREKAEEEERARRAAQKLVQEVTPEMKQKIKLLMVGRDMEKYADEVGRLNRGDMGTLLPQSGMDRDIGWLNDAVINEYLAKVVAIKHAEQGYEKKKGKVPKVHAFQSAFFKTWSSKGYDGIKRWIDRAEISGLKLLEVDTILIPICNGNHWTLLAISGTDRTIQYLNSMSGFGSGDQYIARAKELLAKQLGKHYVDDEWRVLSSKDSNQQINGSDCGVFTAMNGHALLTGKKPRDAFETRDRQDINAARNYMAAVLLGQQI